ncbi:thioredoxin family protein [[Mycoplasma] mobile]|uniref:Thioredoxin n=1 Tax=Mycoplasma mobile (strain ATCC 43663 / 163K / NCTC 11711) TaxID=267748 RepID=Q6KH73_MYCM1|nr:thioredoxin family protein [[Mycoplasma] mobile]AAT28057.1 thioredoxin [Mycoplasma mobile 163K]
MSLQTYKWKDAQDFIEKNHNRVIYLEFATETCGDCRAMAPVVEEFVDHFKNNDKVKFLRVDAEESGLWKVTGNKWEVLRIPTHIVLKNNEIFRKGFEYFPKELLVEWVEEALKNTK